MIPSFLFSVCVVVSFIFVVFIYWLAGGALVRGDCCMHKYAQIIVLLVGLFHIHILVCDFWSCWFPLVDVLLFLVFFVIPWFFYHCTSFCGVHPTVASGALVRGDWCMHNYALATSSSTPHT